MCRGADRSEGRRPGSLRRQLRANLPALAHWFGILPWMVDDLTTKEAEVFLDWLAKANEKKGR